MTIASFPKMNNKSRNPYLYLVKEALEKSNISVVDSNHSNLSLYWLIKNRKKVNILHFQWVQYHYINFRKLKFSLYLFLQFVINIFMAKRLKYKIVWTMHNIQPHENAFPKADRFIRKLIIKNCDAIITHCEYAKQHAKKIWHYKNKIIVLPHPHYIGNYPNNIPKAAAREKLKIPLEALVFTYFGEVRAYKGLAALIEAFHQYENKESRLIIAGNPLFPEYKDVILKQISENNNILPFLEFIPDDQVQIYMNAADIIVLPFSHITMSGSLILGMSFQKPILCPDTGGLPEYVNINNGIIYNHKENQSLLNALKICEKKDLEALGKQAQESIKTFSWENLGQEISKLYSSLYKEKI